MSAQIIQHPACRAAEYVCMGCLGQRPALADEPGFAICGNCGSDQVRDMSPDAVRALIEKAHKALAECAKGTPNTLQILDGVQALSLADEWIENL